MKYLQIHLDNPCSEDWDSMVADEKGRFCAACAKTVVDFTSMPDAEILTFFKKNKGKDLCGRINPYQLENPLPMPSPAPVRYAYAFALATGIALTNAVYAEPPQLSLFEVVSGQNVVNSHQIQEELDTANSSRMAQFNLVTHGYKCNIEVTLLGIKKQASSGKLIFDLPNASTISQVAITVKVTFSDPSVKEVIKTIDLTLNKKNLFDIGVEQIPEMGAVQTEQILINGKFATVVKKREYKPPVYHVYIK